MKAAHDRFYQQVWDYYDASARNLPWRQPNPDKGFEPYNILVSELMLQQTQVPRVVPKYLDFLARFPTASHLAQAPLADVIEAWSGLGYNRRAKYLHDAVKRLHDEPEWTLDMLQQCKGIGYNTAAAVRTYSYNIPHVFIETNIRAVFIHHFFDDGTSVSDLAIAELVHQTLPRHNSREWYWALMDYGTFIKSLYPDIGRRSTHYKKQSPFKDSRRAIRGEIIRLLLERNMTKADMQKIIRDDRLDEALETLMSEGLIIRKDGSYLLPGGFL